jgi:beta-1,4-mannosyltransferase
MEQNTKNLYLFPVTALNETEINPYMNLLCGALKKNYHVVNAGRPQQSGIIDILKYIRRIDIVYLNWIEEIPRRHMGVLQSIFFLVLLQVIGFSPVKVVWTLHNKRSHWKRGGFLSSIIYRQMLRRSDLIVTHAKEGLDSVGERVHSAFIHHPVRPIDYGDPPGGLPGFDIIIWGSIAPYKGIDAFIEFLDHRGVLGDYRILIAGKITSEELAEKFRKWTARGENLVVLDKFVPEPEIMSFIRRSRLVVFTYHSASVLSSGALMDSLSQYAVIIGPHTGAFKDLSELGLIDTFEDYPQLLQIIDKHLKGGTGSNARKARIAAFIQENSWENFAVQIDRLMKEFL